MENTIDSSQRVGQTRWLLDRQVFPRWEAATDGVAFPVITFILTSISGHPEELALRTAISVGLFGILKTAEYFYEKNRLNNLSREGFDEEFGQELIPLIEKNIKEAAKRSEK